MNDQSNTAGFGTADWLMRTVRKNPEGLLLLAAGCALLLRTGGAGKMQRSNEVRRHSGAQDRYDPNAVDHRAHRSSDMSDTIAQGADAARQYASQVGQSLSDTADRSIFAAKEYADNARRTIMDGSQQAAERAQSTIERVVREQPLAVAIAGLAAGAAVAAAFPMTSAEREALGPAGQRLTEAVSSASERLSQAASAAGERIMDVAEEKGLNAEGAKDVGRDVAEAFGRSLRGEQEEKDSAGNRQSALSGVGGAAQPGAGAARIEPSSDPASRTETESQTRTSADLKRSPERPKRS